MIGQRPAERGNLLPLLANRWLVRLSLAAWAALFLVSIAPALSSLRIGIADLWPLLPLAAALLAFTSSRLSFLLTDLRYTFPLVGKLARLSGDPSRSGRGRWLNAELSLCRDYARHFTALSRSEFEHNRTYLRKAADLGRRPLPPWTLLLVFLLVAMESIGITYLLAVATEVGPQPVSVMLVTILLFAWALAAIVHLAGQQLYRTRLLRACWRDFESEPASPAQPVFVNLRDDQAIDDHHSPAGQILGRVIEGFQDRGSYAWLRVAALLTAAAAGALALLRWNVVNSPPYDPFESAGDSGAAAMLGRLVPSTGLTSFALLAIIFLATQILCFALGYRLSLAGRQSAEAYRATRGAPDYDSYWNPVLYRMRIANERLIDLQHRLQRRASYAWDWNHDVLDFIRDQRELGIDDLQLPPGTARSPWADTKAL